MTARSIRRALYLPAWSGTSVTCTPSAAFTTPNDCPGYRLPTEAEWEYAARAGTTTETYNGDPDVWDCSSSTVVDPIAWHCGNSDETTHAVGGLAPNAWGLYDMLGNVSEWCHDWLEDDLGSDPATDPWGPTAGSYRVQRGGAMDEPPENLLAASRGSRSPDDRSGSWGFRPVRSRP